MAVSVDTHKFAGTWGKQPRGHGYWTFSIGGKEYTFRGSYSEAKSKAIKVATRDAGVTRIYVLP